MRQTFVKGGEGEAEYWGEGKEEEELEDEYWVEGKAWFWRKGEATPPLGSPRREAGADEGGSSFVKGGEGEAEYWGE